MWASTKLDFSLHRTDAAVKRSENVPQISKIEDLDAIFVLFVIVMPTKCFVWTVSVDVTEAKSSMPFLS